MRSDKEVKYYILGVTNWKPVNRQTHERYKKETIFDYNRLVNKKFKESTNV